MCFFFIIILGLTQLPFKQTQALTRHVESNIVRIPEHEKRYLERWILKEHSDLIIVRRKKIIKKFPKQIEYHQVRGLHRPL